MSIYLNNIYDILIIFHLTLKILAPITEDEKMEMKKYQILRVINHSKFYLIFTTKYLSSIILHVIFKETKIFPRMC